MEARDGDTRRSGRGAGKKTGRIAADMDTFGYLDGRIAHLERRIATLESTDRGAASPKAQGD